MDEKDELNQDGELKQAYQKLGLPENSSREEVEKRYELLMRQERKRKRENPADAEPSPEFEEINRAYKLIMEHEKRKVVDSITGQQYGKYKRLAGPMQKLDYFFQYYKWHLVIGILIVAGIIYGVNTYLERQEEKARLAALPPADLEAVFVGQFFLPDQSTDTAPVEEAIVEQMPGWKRAVVRVHTLDMERQDMYDVAMQQKVIIELATEQPDVYITDSNTFYWLANNGVLRELDAEVQGRFKDLLPEGAAMRTAIVNHVPGEEEAEPAEEEEHVYGINVGASPLAEELPIMMEDMIVGIRLDAKNTDNALDWIEQYLRAMSTDTQTE